MELHERLLLKLRLIEKEQNLLKVAAEESIKVEENLSFVNIEEPAQLINEEKTELVEEEKVEKPESTPVAETALEEEPIVKIKTSTKPNTKRK